MKSYICNTTLNPSYIFSCNYQLLVLCYSKGCVVISTIFKFCWLYSFYLEMNPSYDSQENISNQPEIKQL